MQGIGNDFVVVNGFEYAEIDDPGELARRMCDRHFGIGADGLIWMVPSDCADAQMRIFNSDGSEPEMCGNGLRCAAQYMLDAGITDKKVMTIETGAGVLTVTIDESGITADMGEPILEPAQIPVYSDSNRIVLNIEGKKLGFFCASMGNPHAVTFDLFPEDDSFYRLGPALEHHAAFPAKANIEFCRVRDGGIDVRVWERGDGETLACGTGACATLTAAASLGFCGRESAVRLPGGELFIRWAENNHLYMTGPAETVFEGEWVK
jgi:diaminopimelate epimerase